MSYLGIYAIIVAIFFAWDILTLPKKVWDDAASKIGPDDNLLVVTIGATLFLIILGYPIWFVITPFRILSAIANLF